MHRLIDVLLLIIFLPIVLPVFIIIVLICKICHGKNIFFYQDRLGKSKKIFKLIKFRSMVYGAQNMGTGLYSYKNDQRITPLGKILRKTSLDELPQLINILLGDMSFVGPRPAVVGELEVENNLPDDIDCRFNVKPGLTGWAQIHGRDNLSWAEKAKYDIEFVKANSFRKCYMCIIVIFFTPFYLFNFSVTYETKR